MWYSKMEAFVSFSQHVITYVYYAARVGVQYTCDSLCNPYR